jgi:hypothetical protein
MSTECGAVLSLMCVLGALEYRGMHAPGYPSDL